MGDPGACILTLNFDAASGAFLDHSERDLAIVGVPLEIHRQLRRGQRHALGVCPPKAQAGREMAGRPSRLIGVKPRPNGESYRLIHVIVATCG